MKRTLLFSPSSSLTDSLNVYEVASTFRIKKFHSIPGQLIHNQEEPSNRNPNNQEQSPSKNGYGNSTSGDSVFSDDDLSNPLRVCLMKLRYEKGLKKLAKYEIEPDRQSKDLQDGITLKQRLKRKVATKYREYEELGEKLYKN